LVASTDSAFAQDRFEGRHFRGVGDTDYLRLLDTARRMFEPDPEFLNMAMLYEPTWNGLVEGPTWGAWWIQNSYGPTYCALPFYQEPFVTFLQHSQDLWFDQMGDGRRAGARDWVAPDGCLCDAAAPGWIVYKQGDGRVDIHDWGMEFTAAGIVLQAELLLISRDRQALAHYLPLLERSADFIESRRDPDKHLFLAGPAGNLLAPSYAGWRRPDGTYDRAYLAGLSVTYIAALDRLIELEKLAGREDGARLYAERRDLARRGLPLLTTPEGYLIKSLDPDGVRHGVYGAERHGYFEASPNHDAIALRVVDDDQARRIYDQIASIPELRPHDFILPNYPSYDDMYEEPRGLWAYGHWVNGGHWSTCEARMILAYYRLGRYEDARRSLRQLMKFARDYRMDNPLTDFGDSVYQPKLPYNVTCDAFGPPAALIRGLFEYLYRAEGLTLVPHIPPAVTQLEQLDPIRFGSKRLYLATIGTGPVTGVRVNGQPWGRHDGESVLLPYDETPEEARIVILLGGSQYREPAWDAEPREPVTDPGEVPPVLALLDQRAAAIQGLVDRLEAEGKGRTYDAGHARLAVRAVAAVHERRRMLADGALQPLADPDRQAAVDRLYLDTAIKLCDGLKPVLRAHGLTDDPRDAVFQGDRYVADLADVSLWRQIRRSSGANEFAARDACAVMATSGKGDAKEGNSVGWRLKTHVLPTDRFGELRLTLRGTAGAKFYVDVFDDDGLLVSSGWRASPTDAQTVSFPLAAGRKVTAVQLYTLSEGDGRVENWFSRLEFVPGGAPRQAE